MVISVQQQKCGKVDKKETEINELKKGKREITNGTWPGKEQQLYYPVETSPRVVVCEHQP